MNLLVSYSPRLYAGSGPLPQPLTPNPARNRTLAWVQDSMVVVTRLQDTTWYSNMATRLFAPKLLSAQLVLQMSPFEDS